VAALGQGDGEVVVALLDPAHRMGDDAVVDEEEP
jgi:hypothetical protein